MYPKFVKKHEERQLPIISALIPSLVLNKIGVVQALDRRQGAVFYMDIEAGTTKGAITANDDLISAKTGHASSIHSRRYASSYIPGESVGSSGSTSYSGNLSKTPILAGTVTITDGVENFEDNGSGVLVSDLSGGTNGTINYTSGAYSVTFASSTTTAPTATYQIKYDQVTGGVPEINLSLTSETLTAIDFPLRANYSMAAAELVSMAA